MKEDIGKGRKDGRKGKGMKEGKEDGEEGDEGRQRKEGEGRKGVRKGSVCVLSPLCICFCLSCVLY